jgi:hypothetical protein
MNASSAFGRVTGNSLGDIYGPLNVHAACTVITGGIIWTVLGMFVVFTNSGDFFCLLLY